jgi:hypothetical protein
MGLNARRDVLILGIARIMFRPLPATCFRFFAKVTTQDPEAQDALWHQYEKRRRPAGTAPLENRK